MIKIVENFSSGRNWYRKYSDGWIEQGGYISDPIGTDDMSIVPVTFHIAFTNPPLNVRTNVEGTGTTSAGGTQLIVLESSITTTGFDVFNDSYGSTANDPGYFWEACGY